MITHFSWSIATCHSLFYTRNISVNGFLIKSKEKRKKRLSNFGLGLNVRFAYFVHTHFPPFCFSGLVLLLPWRLGWNRSFKYSKDKGFFLVTFYASPITSHNLPYVLFTFLIKFSKFKNDRFFIVFTHIESMDIPSNIVASTESYIFFKDSKILWELL